MIKTRKFLIFVYLLAILILVSCRTLPDKLDHNGICQKIMNADQKELNTICQLLLDEETNSIEMLIECLKDDSELKTPLVKLKVKYHWEEQIYLSPRTISDLSLTLLAIKLEKWQYLTLQNTAVFPLEDCERDRTISEFLDWYVSEYKKN